MVEGMSILKQKMQLADKVEIKTGYRSSVFNKGIDAISCGGTHNIPDGEVFSCPVRKVSKVKLPLTQTRFIKEPLSNISLIFEKGKIISATASSNEEVLINFRF